ncbi:dihydrodipicolinate synthase family protein [Paracnuella aquatica]|uniref:dihydrodipicolinate synthase family protein n=1 Tax=Paracnuella aquatica TaxID=2268757 RepID=UPI000DEEFD1E|nr:dihydrodipicolinate synthase family protein [Paracnuella aquatica]RPD45576.1 dihydrodipicolinate synthetase [Paracnuella aquatica]
MQLQHLSGLIAAPFTPMHPDGTLNLSIIPKYYTLLKENGVTGAFICGSTGEGVSLSVAEKKAVAEAWAAAVSPDADFKVMTLVGGTSVAESCELARHAADCGLYGVAYTAPFYFKPASVDVLAETCAQVAAAAPHLPFYYYHIPVLTGVGYSMKGLLQAVHGRIPNFAGIKYTHEDFMDFLSCMHFEGGRYDMLWGRDENMLAALALGAKGAVGSTYNYAAPLYSRMIEAYEAGDMEAARQFQLQSIHMIELLGKYGGIATGKAYMRKLGLDCGAFRLPVRNMSDAQFELFSKEVDGLLFQSYCSSMPVEAAL